MEIKFDYDCTCNKGDCDCYPDNDIYKALRGGKQSLDGVGKSQVNEGVISEGTHAFQVIYAKYIDAKDRCVKRIEREVTEKMIEIFKQANNPKLPYWSALNEVKKGIVKAFMSKWRPREDYQYPLTVSQLDEIQQIIKDNQDAFMVEYNGMEPFYAKERIKELIKKGYLSKSVKLREDFLENMFWVARMGDLIEGSPDYVDMVKQAYHIPPQTVDLAGMDWIRLNGANYIQGLGNGYAKEVKQLMTEKWRDVIRSYTIDAGKARMGAGRLESELKHATQDFGRRWDRVAVTELNNLQQNGMASKILKDAKGKDPLVIKIPNESACEGCKKAYLKPDGSYRVFRLSELQANGSNVFDPDLGRRRRQSEWKPVVESMHPYCLCEMVRYVGEQTMSDKELKNRKLVVRKKKEKQ